MGIWKDGKRQAEIRAKVASSPASRSAQLRQLAIHLYAGREQQYVALETRQAQAHRHAIDRGRHAEQCPAALNFFLSRRRAVAREQALDPGELRHQQTLIGVSPVEAGFGRVHEITMR